MADKYFDLRCTKKYRKSKVRIFFLKEFQFELLIAFNFTIAYCTYCIVVRCALTVKSLQL